MSVDYRGVVSSISGMLLELRDGVPLCGWKIMIVEMYETAGNNWI